MSSQFDWESFESISDNPEKTFHSTSFDWDQYKSLNPPIPKESFNLNEVLIESGKGLGRIAGRGAVSLLAAPSKGIGGLLELLSKIYPEDTGLRGAPRKVLSTVGRFLQDTGKEGQKYLNSLIEEVLGKSYGPEEEALSQFIERVGDIYGRGPFKGMGVPAVVGGGAGQIAKELGASEEIQQLAELGGIGAKDIVKGMGSLLKTEKNIEKSGLQLPRVVEKTKEGFKFIKGKVFPKSKEKVIENVSKQAEDLFRSIKSIELPLSVQIEKGIDIEGKLNKELESVNKIASQMDQQIESNLISNYLTKVEEKIRGVPVPTKEQEEILGLISKFKQSFGEFNGKRFYKPGEYVKQYRNINKDAKTLYERAFIEGKKQETREFYRGLNKEIEKTLEAGTPDSFSNLFKETNAQYHELQKIKSFDNIMESILTNGNIDPKKLGNIFRSSSKSKLLRKQIGEEGFQKMKLISNDLEKVQDKLGLIEEIGAKDIVKSATVGVLLNKMGVLGKIGIPLQAAKKGAELGYGYFLINPKGQRAFDNFLKALQSGNKKAIERYLKIMDKIALDEESKNKKSSDY